MEHAKKKNSLQADGASGPVDGTVWTRDIRHGVPSCICVAVFLRFPLLVDLSLYKIRRVRLGRLQNRRELEPDTFCCAPVCSSRSRTLTSVLMQACSLARRFVR